MYEPPEDFRSRARVRSVREYTRLYQRSIKDAQEFWGMQAGALQWFHPHTTVLDTDGEGEFSWFGGGRLNAAVNCVDRHAARHPDKVAFHWAKREPGVVESITYQELKHRVGRMANLLREKGVVRGERVCLYLPMIPDLPVAMMACTRIGAIHVVVYAGYSAHTLRKRVQETGARVVITAAELISDGRVFSLKGRADQAVEGLADVKWMLVSRNTASPERTPMSAPRDEWLDDGCARHRVTCPAEWMPSEEPLFIMHTSGTFEDAKGLVYATAGYLLQAYISHRYIFDLREDDVHLCISDIGRIVGHTYAVYGPLLNGITSVLLEDPQSMHEPERFSKSIDQLGITSLYTTPFVLEQLRQHEDAIFADADLSSLRIIGVVGETIKQDLWEWSYKRLGQERCPIIDTWWQAETGSVLLSPLPGAHSLEPGAVVAPFFGVVPLLLDEKGEEITDHEQEGTLCFKHVWPGLARTIYNDHLCYLETYFRKYPGTFCTYERGQRDAKGHYRITGRADEVIHVNGHRMNTSEIEQALLHHEAVFDAVVVSYPHTQKPQGICAWVIPEEGLKWQQDELSGALKEQVRQHIGAHATPDVVILSESYPTTAQEQVHEHVRAYLQERTNISK